jgi:peptidoglycan/xylan/chitin deacetylase (PgdA/CDA1 family)
MSGTILMGYDVETASESTRGFLEGAQELHQKHDAPWTIYLTGQTIEARAEDIKRVADDPLLTIAQHTYNHVLLKSIYMTPGDGKPIHGDEDTAFVKGGSLEEVCEEIESTQKILKDLIGVDCRGLTGPWGYYRGLADRPDILQVLEDNGIRWIRTFARDERDCQPTPFTVQPFFYRQHGFPEILELGVQGYQDDFYWERFDDRRHGDTYQDYIYAMLEEVAQNDWVWNMCSHDHGTPTKEAFFETKGEWLEDFILRARDLNIRVVAPEDFYAELRAAA